MGSTQGDSGGKAYPHIKYSLDARMYLASKLKEAVGMWRVLHLYDLSLGQSRKILILIGRRIPLPLKTGRTLTRTQNAEMPKHLRCQKKRFGKKLRRSIEKRRQMKTQGKEENENELRGSQEQDR